MKLNIQYLAYNEDKRFLGKGITLSKISSPRSLDEFQINIIDLTDSQLWKCDSVNINGINIRNEFLDLKKMIEESSNTEVLIIMPQNIRYSYYWQMGNDKKYRYSKSLEIKEIIGKYLEFWIGDLAEIPPGILVYEKTITSINGMDYPADFHFSNKYFDDNENILTKSFNSNKKTTMKFYSTYFTVLEITSYEELINFLHHTELIQLKETMPDWLLEIKLFDDAEQNQIINCKEKIICDCNNHINIAKEKLKENDKYKSILYTNGDELLEVVFEMLEKMLSYDLSTFKDEKKRIF